MPRRPRRDEPGDWFHVFNRAVARRTMFETRSDMRDFLNRLAEVAGRRWIEVHAYTVLTTHFHLLVRSPNGQMSRAMHQLQLGYVRRFNRTRQRDGPLLRGRFTSLLVESYRYRRVLIGYIDRNATAARLAEHPADYPFASCRHHMFGDGPPWLARDWVDEIVQDERRQGESRADAYGAAFLAGFADAHSRLVEARIARGGNVPADATESLLRSQAPAVVRWFRRKARLADGTLPGVPLVPVDVIAGVVRAAGGGDPGEWRPRWRRLLALLLREVSAASFDEVARLLAVSQQGARKVVAAARRLATEDEAFAVLAARLTKEALGIVYARDSVAGDRGGIPGEVVV
ncbi:MAG TPA: hypothetical protein ENI87_14335 [bacterium]|nr:hypothetical protein [bacterium]